MKTILINKNQKLMRKFKLLTGTGFIIAASFFLLSADHMEAPSIEGSKADIADFYAFQAQNTENIVFVATLQGLMSPSATAGATFDENVLTEFNIDTNGDAIEDLVIQAIPRNGKMYFFGPMVPSSTGLNSTILSNSTDKVVDITPYGSNAITASQVGMKFFAGPRDDPFFMDFAQYGEILAGNASGFNNPGTDSFAGTNVLAIVVEVPKSEIGGSGTINVWLETKQKQ